MRSPRVRKIFVGARKRDAAPGVPAGRSRRTAGDPHPATRTLTTGSGRTDGPETIRTGHRKAPHWVRNVRIATEANTGFDIGTVIAKKVCQWPAPSIRAAFSMLGRIAWKNVANRKKEKALAMKGMADEAVRGHGVDVQVAQHHDRGAETTFVTAMVTSRLARQRFAGRACARSRTADGSVTDAGAVVTAVRSRPERLGALGPGGRGRRLRRGLLQVASRPRPYQSLVSRTPGRA